MSELLTLDDAAARLHVSRRTVERLIAGGRIRVTKVGRRPLVLETELETYLASTTRRR